MAAQDYITLSIVAAAVIIAVAVTIRRFRGTRKKGGEKGCDGGCAGCGGGSNCGCRAPL